MLVFIGHGGNNSHGIGAERLKAFQNNALGRRLAGIAMALAVDVGTLGASTGAHAGSISVHVSAGNKPADDAAVVVAMAKDAAPATVNPGTKAVMVQEQKQFVPFVLPVQLGTIVEFPNHDLFRHHVYSFSPAKTFELKLYGGGESQAVTFDKEGVIALGCNIHDTMLAYIYVVGTPYFATTKGGAQVLANLPAGTYTVKAWHPDQRVGTQTSQEVTVTADGTVNVDLTLTLKQARRRTPGAADENAY